RALVHLNRTAMHTVDLQAQRLGTAGAWAAVFVALFSFGASIFVLRRLEGRVVEPLEELGSVLEQVTSGDRFRRCRAFEAPDEIAQALSAVNALLDERLLHAPPPEPELGWV